MMVVASDRRPSELGARLVTIRVSTREPRNHLSRLMTSAYEDHLDRNEANYTPLTPLSLIARTAYVYPNKVPVVHADRRYTCPETYSRSRRLASALKLAGIGHGDTVALTASNKPEMLEAHFPVPL